MDGEQLAVSSNKRPLTPDSVQTSAKQKRGNYWLASVSTANKFQVLENADETETEMSSVTEENLSHVNSPRVQKPPPIFVSGVEEMKLLIQQLDLTAKDDYDIRILQNDEVKKQPKTPESYSAIIKDLAKKETRFHTFPLKQDKLQGRP